MKKNERSSLIWEENIKVGVSSNEICAWELPLSVSE